MKQLLIRGISEELDQRIREKAKKEKKTIKGVIIEILEGGFNKGVSVKEKLAWFIGSEKKKKRN